MAVVPSVLSGLFTDQTVDAVDWRAIRDNLETNHDHSGANERRLQEGSLANLAVTGAKVASGAVLNRHLFLTTVHIFSAVTFNAGSAADAEDTPLTISLTVPVDSVFELYYQSYGAAGFGGEFTNFRWKVNGVVETNSTHYGLVTSGTSSRSPVAVTTYWRSLSAGSHTFIPIFARSASGGSFILPANRRTFCVVYGQ